MNLKLVDLDWVQSSVPSSLYMTLGKLINISKSASSYKILLLSIFDPVILTLLGKRAVRSESTHPEELWIS